MRKIFLAVACVVSLWACPRPLSEPMGSVDGGAIDAGPMPSTYTWYRDVQPLVQTHCQSCHTAQGSAPFPLDTFEQAAERHALLAASVASGSMPPWQPSDACQSFRGKRGMTVEERAIFETWSNENAPMGNAADTPAAPVVPDAGLEWVDVDLTPAEGYTPNMSLSDDYRCFVIQPNFTEAVDLIGFDIVPGKREWVHHVILFSGDAADAQALDAAEAGPGWTCFGGPGTQNPQMLGGWVPGTSATKYPDDTGIRIPANKILVMQVHYNTSHMHSGHGHSSETEVDLTEVKMQFARTPLPTGKRAIIFPIAQTSFVVPPNSSNVQASEELTSIANVQLRGMLPHMHTRGTKIKVEVGNECLIDIPQWDFNWQQFYFYENAIAVSAGAKLKLTCTWNNPTDKTLRWGEGTDDEMCLNYFYFTPQ